MTIVIKVTLDYIYVEYIFPYFAYDTFTLNFNFSNFIISTFILLLTTITINRFDTSNSSLRLPIYVFFFSLIIPLATVASFESMSIIYYLNIMIAFNIILGSIIFFPKIQLISISNKIIYIILSLLSLIYFYTYIMLILSGGFSRINFNLEEVYEVREQLSQNTFFLSNYFISWVGYSLNPILIVLGLVKKNKYLFIFGISMQLLLFSMTNYKSFLFSILLLVIVYVITNKSRLFLKLGMLILTALILMYIHFLIFGPTIFTSSFLRRQFFVPAHLHFLYNDFFSNNPFIHLSDSILSVIFDYKYNVSVTRVISNFYWGKDFGPNVGFFGNAYYNFGVFGIYLFSFILCFLLKVVQSFENILSNKLIATLILIPFMALINSGLFTTLLTHSLLLTILCIWLLFSFEKNRRI